MSAVIRLDDARVNRACGSRFAAEAGVVPPGGTEAAYSVEITAVVAAA